MPYNLAEALVYCATLSQHPLGYIVYFQVKVYIHLFRNEDATATSFMLFSKDVSIDSNAFTIRAMVLISISKGELKWLVCKNRCPVYCIS